MGIQEQSELFIRAIGQQAFDAMRPDLKGEVVTEVTFIFETIDDTMQPRTTSISSLTRRPWLRFGLLLPEATAAINTLTGGHDSSGPDLRILDEDDDT